MDGRAEKCIKLQFEMYFQDLGVDFSIMLKVNLKDIGFEAMNWIHMAQDRG
jgi:hypothetical protein